MVKVDEESFVTEVHSELEPEPQPALRVCHGPWHYKSGKGTLLHESEFAIATRGPNRGGLSSTCRECRDRNSATVVRLRKEKREMESNIRNGTIALQEITTPEPDLPQWRVTIIKLTEVIVSAKDYLDAGVAAGDGEVVKVERLR